MQSRECLITTFISAHVSVCSAVGSKMSLQVVSSSKTLAASFFSTLSNDTCRQANYSICSEINFCIQRLVVPFPFFMVPVPFLVVPAPFLVVPAPFSVVFAPFLVVPFTLGWFLHLSWWFLHLSRWFPSLSWWFLSLS